MRALLTTIALSFLLFGAHCPKEPKPVIADDIEDCPAAAAKLTELDCEEGRPAPDGQTFEQFCTQTMTLGHAMRPSCLKTIESCDEIETKCGQ
jgi:hypothetical protein